MRQKLVGGIKNSEWDSHRLQPVHILFWCLQTILLNSYIIKIREGKYKYFQWNFNEKTNYTHNFDEKIVLLWCDKNEINGEILGERKLIFIEILSFYFLFFNVGRKFNKSTFTFQP